MKAGELCIRNVITADPGDSTIACARRMEEHGVGDLVVVEGFDGGVRPVGIVTDRDLVTRGLARGGAEAGRLHARDVMSERPLVAAEDDDIDAVLAKLRKNGIRRIPVVGSRGELVGILSLDDVMAWITEQMRDATALLDRQGGGLGAVVPRP